MHFNMPDNVKAHIQALALATEESRDEKTEMIEQFVAQLRHTTCEISVFFVDTFLSHFDAVKTRAQKKEESFPDDFVIPGIAGTPKSCLPLRPLPIPFFLDGLAHGLRPDDPMLQKEEVGEGP